jgi:hypothetical protein
MSASEGYLEEVMGNAFQIDPASGSLKTNFAPKDYMKGYFSFKVQAKDTGKFLFFRAFKTAFDNNKINGSSILIFSREHR